MAKQLRKKPRLSTIINSLVQGNDYDKEIPYYLVLVESEQLRDTQAFLVSNMHAIPRIGMADIAFERITMDVEEAKSPPQIEGDALDIVLEETFEKFHERFREALLSDNLNEAMMDLAKELREQTGNILEDEN